MIPTLRQQFNANFTPEKYQRLLKVMEQRCGTPVKFRMCETPVFLPKPLLDQMCDYGKELIHQLNNHLSIITISAILKGFIITIVCMKNRH